MNDLEMIKAFTELELKNGISCHKSIEFDEIQCVYWVETVGFSSYPLIDAITDLGLNCAARDKYKITIFYYPKGVIAACYRDISVKVEKRFASKAVIECILKSEGLWK